MEAKINIFQNNAKNSNVILTSRSNEMDQSFKIFQNEDFGKIRVVIDEKGEPWFVGNDIAKCLGYDTPKNAVKKYVDEDDSFMFVIDSESRDIKMNPTENQYVKEIRLINESGLYFGLNQTSAGTVDHTDGEDVRANLLKGRSSAKSEAHESLAHG